MGVGGGAKNEEAKQREKMPIKIKCDTRYRTVYIFNKGEIKARRVSDILLNILEFQLIPFIHTVFPHNFHLIFFFYNNLFSFSLFPFPHIHTLVGRFLYVSF